MAKRSTTSRSSSSRSSRAKSNYRVLVPAEIVILSLILALVSVRHWLWHWGYGILVFVLTAALSIALYAAFRPFRWAFVISFSVLWAYILAELGNMLYPPLTGFWYAVVIAVVFVLSFRLHVWEWYKMTGER